MLKDWISGDPGLVFALVPRGAAQNANGNSKLNTPWILDRGGWSMTSIRKAFNYIVSTTREDQQVGKALAGWGSESKPGLPTLHLFDPMVSEKIRQLQQLLFASAFGFTAEFNFHDDVLEVLMAVAVLHYHDMLRLAPTSPYIKRVQHGLAQVSVTESELGSWSLTILGDLLQRKKKLGEPEEKPQLRRRPTT